MAIKTCPAMLNNQGVSNWVCRNMGYQRYPMVIISRMKLGWSVKIHPNPEVLETSERVCLPRTQWVLIIFPLKLLFWYILDAQFSHLQRHPTHIKLIIYVKIIQTRAAIIKFPSLSSCFGISGIFPMDFTSNRQSHMVLITMGAPEMWVTRCSFTAAKMSLATTLRRQTLTPATAATA